jgi:hypothetical protein
MFNSKGWEEFQKEIQVSLSDAVEGSADTCIENSQWQFRRGEIFKLRQIAGYEDYIRAVLAQIEDDYDASV